MIHTTEHSPRIDKISWGKMEIENIGMGKDFKLWPGGGRQWDWNETNTRHVPGIQIVDIKELIDHGAEDIVLSRGMFLALQTCQDTKQFLQDEGIPFQIQETRQAALIYNQLVDNGVAVGGLFHSTC